MIDTHGHLSDSRYDLERDDILADMLAVGVEAIVDSGTSLINSMDTVANATHYANVFCEIGVHPGNVDEYHSSQLDTFRDMAKQPKVIGVGEIGLDYHYEGYDRDLQMRVMRELIEFSHTVSLPVTIHVREAYQDALSVLKDMRGYLTNGVRLHCYSGSREMLREFDKFDCYYSFGGVVTFSNFRHQDVVRAVPRDRLLLETDCPYLTPVPMRGKTNYPMYLPYVAGEIARVLQMDIEDIDHLTTTNAHTLYERLKI